MKKIYETPKIEIIEFDCEDVITTSTPENETPGVDLSEMG